ncbi:hypothetical protein D3C81_06860 [compost metagenome]
MSKLNYDTQSLCDSAMVLLSQKISIKSIPMVIVHDDIEEKTGKSSYYDPKTKVIYVQLVTDSTRMLWSLIVGIGEFLYNDKYKGVSFYSQNYNHLSANRKFAEAFKDFIMFKRNFSMDTINMYRLLVLKE